MKHPHCSNTCSGAKAGAEKAYKKAAHRRCRRVVRIAIVMGDFDNFPHDREFGNPWRGAPKDGKQRIPKDAPWWSEYRRK